MERGASALQEVGELAREAGVTIAVEALNRYENNLVNTLADIASLVERVDHPSLGIHLDLFHANIEESDLCGAIRRAGSKLVHCHAVDNTRGAPGSGHLAWPEILGALHDAGYDGAFVIESFDPGNAAWAPATSSWRPLAPTQDDLARSGLAFLKAAWEASALDRR
jgi:D-psicose/D-tagatose/L-ribulose 3-epimerase